MRMRSVSVYCLCDVGEDETKCMASVSGARSQEHCTNISINVSIFPSTEKHSKYISQIKMTNSYFNYLEKNFKCSGA